MEIHKSKPVLWLCFYRHILVFPLDLLHKKILIFHFKWVSKSTCGTPCTTNELPLTLVRHAHVILRLAFSRQYFLIPIIDIPCSIPNSKANLKSLMLRKKYSPHIEKENVRTSGQFTSILFQFLQDFFASKSHSI